MCMLFSLVSVLNVHYLSSVWLRNAQLWEEEITATSPIHVG